MNPVSRRSFLPQWPLLALAMLLGLHKFSQAAPSEKEEPKDKQDTINTPTAPGKEEKISKNNQDTTNTKSTAQNKDKTAGNNEEAERTESTPDKEEENEPPKKPRLRKPKPLEPVKLAQEDPLAPLDKLIVKQEVSLAPYVPLVQTIDIAVDYGRLAMNLWRRKERRYVGSLSILWRKNIQLSGTWGYNRLCPNPVNNSCRGVVLHRDCSAPP
ncbi:MAG: hypothetical protein AAFQ01_01575 [Bacteroidota bacterium]